MNDCPNSLCDGKVIGNYEIQGKPNRFVQCDRNSTNCEICWPSTLVFSEKCNQCLYNKHDDCPNTELWKPADILSCSDVCTSKGIGFSGNLPDPSSKSRYVACWKGEAVGCRSCPPDLEFNAELNACLYNGRLHTNPPPSTPADVLTIQANTTNSIITQ